MRRFSFLLCCAVVLLCKGNQCIAMEGLVASEQKPNVILIMTDDMGLGDVGVNGNTMLKTPELDKLAKQSVQLTDYHVDPTCAETRAALMTGRYSCRTGICTTWIPTDPRKKTSPKNTPKWSRSFVPAMTHGGTAFRRGSTSMSESHWVPRLHLMS